MPPSDDFPYTVDMPLSIVPDRPETRIHFIKGRDGPMPDLHWTKDFVMQKNLSTQEWTQEYHFQKELHVRGSVPPAKTLFDHLIQDDLLPES